MKSIDDKSLWIGFALGVLSVTVILPGTAWLMLRASETKRRDARNYVARTVTQSVIESTSSLQGGAGNALRNIAIPAVEVAVGKRWGSFIYEMAGVPAGNAIIETMSLPPVIG